MSELSTLILQIRTDTRLPKRKRLEHCSALRSFARCLGRSPHAIPVSADYFREELPALIPARTKLSPSRLKQIRAALGFALEYTGAGEGIRPRNRIMAPEFGKLLSLIKNPWRRASLVGFFCFCTAKAVSVRKLDSQHLHRYYDYLSRASLAPNASRRTRMARDAWNKCAREFSCWPDTILHFSARAKPTRPLDSSFQRDLDNYTRFMSGKLPHPLTGHPISNPLSQATVRLHRKVIARCAALAANMDLKPRSIETLIRPQSLRTIYNYLIEHQSDVTAQHIRTQMRILVRAAQLWALRDENIPRRPQTYSSERRLPSSIEKFRQIHDLLDTGCFRLLLELPQNLMRNALNENLCRRKRMASAHASVGLEIMLLIPLLPIQVVGLRIGMELVENPERSGKFTLLIPTLKNRRRILEYELPTRTGLLIQIYRKHFLPDWQHGRLLFADKTGKRRQAWAFSKTVSTKVFQHVGTRLTLRAVRFLAATLYLQRHPRDYEVVRRAMGHTSIEYTRRAFGIVRVVHSFRSFDALLADRALS